MDHGAVSHLSGYLDSYLVVAAYDERVITMGRRFKRIPSE